MMEYVGGLGMLGWIMILSILGGGVGGRVGVLEGEVGRERLRMEGKYRKYMEEESKGGTGMLYDYELGGDEMMSMMERWYGASNEREALEVLKEGELKGISIGDFNKVVMRICNISREMERGFEILEDLKNSQIMREIPGKIMKYIINNQSLYIQ